MKASWVEATSQETARRPHAATLGSRHELSVRQAKTHISLGIGAVLISCAATRSMGSLWSASSSNALHKPWPDRLGANLDVSLCFDAHFNLLVSAMHQPT